MNPNLINHVMDAFSQLNVLIIGEAMLDSYLKGSADRLCREAPVPVVSVSEREHVPGGAANTAVNVRSLGAEVAFLSVTGDDEDARLLEEALDEYGVSKEHILHDTARRTLTKQRVIAGSQMVVRFDQGHIDPLSPETEEAMIERMKLLFPKSDAVIISDYGYGVMTERAIHALMELQRSSPRVLVVDAKRLKEYRHVKMTAVKPNYHEALELLKLGYHKPVGMPGRNGDRVDHIAKSGGRILKLTGAEIAVVTLDQDGALVFTPGEIPYRTYATPEPNSRAAGAGDTFVGALTLSLAAGAHVENAAELASAAASIVVAKDGTAVCYADELRAYFSKAEKFVADVFQFAGRMAAYNREGRKIVFTNGCFDILHRGHINYLNRAKALGDILIVGVNSDESVRRLKGANRPINSLEDRVQILAALSCVDHLVAFDGDTPHDLIRIIQPDIFVKGGDYTRETLPEAQLVEELGGKVYILPYLDDHSTTGIIEKIRERFTDAKVEAEPGS